MSKVDDWPTLTNDDLVSTSGETNDFENFCNLNITMSSWVNYGQRKYK